MNDERNSNPTPNEHFHILQETETEKCKQNKNCYQLYQVPSEYTTELYVVNIDHPEIHRSPLCARVLSRQWSEWSE